MKENREHLELPADVAEQLHALLDTWAQQQSVDEATVRRIRGQIVGSTAPLSVEWWHTFSRQLANSIRAANSAASTSLAGLGWLHDESRAADRATDSRFRPYYRPA